MTGNGAAERCLHLEPELAERLAGPGRDAGAADRGAPAPAPRRSARPPRRRRVRSTASRPADVERDRVPRRPRLAGRLSVGDALLELGAERPGSRRASAARAAAARRAARPPRASASCGSAPSARGARSRSGSRRRTAPARRRSASRLAASAARLQRAASASRSPNRRSGPGRSVERLERDDVAGAALEEHALAAGPAAHVLAQRPDGVRRRLRHVGADHDGMGGERDDGADRARRRRRRPGAPRRRGRTAPRGSSRGSCRPRAAGGG